jgi:ACT domain-containing protein
MVQKAIEEAHESFREALKVKAGTFASGKVEEAEHLINEAKRLLEIDRSAALNFAEQAKKMASESITDAIEQRNRLKRKYGTAMASCLDEVSRLKHTILDIERALTHSNVLALNQQMDVAETEIRKMRQALNLEDFQLVGSTFDNVRHYLQDIHTILDPMVKQLEYQMPERTLSRGRQRKSQKKGINS